LAPPAVIREDEIAWALQQMREAILEARRS
jgi:hypothetical protein